MLALVYVRQAYDHIKADRFEMARGFIIKGLKLLPGDQYLLMARCAASFKQGMIKFALPDCEAALGKAGDAGGYAFAAGLHLNHKSLVTAAALFKKSLALKPGYPDALAGLAETLMATYPVTSQDQREAIMQELESTVELLQSKHPDFPRLMLVKGKLLLLKGSFLEAETTLRACTNKHPDLREAFLLLSKIYLSSESWADLQALLEGYVQRFPDDLEVKEMLLQVYGNLKMETSARQLAEAILKQDSKHKGINLTLAKMLLKAEKPEAALIYIDKELLLQPDIPEISYLKAELLFNMKKTDECKALLKKLLARSPKFISAYMMQYAIASAAGDKKEAAAVVKTVGDTIIRGELIMARQMIQLGYEEEGVAVLESYYAGHEDDEEAAVMLGLVYKQLGKEEALAKHMNKALTLSPNKDMLQQRFKEALDALKPGAAGK